MLSKVLIGHSSKSYFSLADAHRWADVVARELPQRSFAPERPGEGTFLCVPYPLLPLMPTSLGPAA